MFQRILRHSWPSITWTAVIFILLTMPGKLIPSQGLFGIPNLDKIVHSILFGGFVWLWVKYFTQKKKDLKPVQLIIIFFLIGSAYGIGMEFFQRYVLTDRQFDGDDIIADVLGAGLAAIFCYMSLRGKSWGGEMDEELA